MSAKAFPQQSKDARFYLAMAIASACFVFFGFARTYYLKPYFGTPQLRPLFICMDLSSVRGWSFLSYKQP